MFDGNTWSVPKECKSITKNNILDDFFLQETNALAYFGKGSLTKKNVIKNHHQGLILQNFLRL
jgi:hypothetical protein